MTRKLPLAACILSRWTPAPVHGLAWQCVISLSRTALAREWKLLLSGDLIKHRLIVGLKRLNPAARK